MSKQIIYRWKQKCGGLEGSELRCLNQLVANKALGNQLLKELLEIGR